MPKHANLNNENDQDIATDWYLHFKGHMIFDKNYCKRIVDTDKIEGQK